MREIFLVVVVLKGDLWCKVRDLRKESEREDMFLSCCRGRGRWDSEEVLACKRRHRRDSADADELSTGSEWRATLELEPLPRHLDPPSGLLLLGPVSCL